MFVWEAELPGFGKAYRAHVKSHHES
jgi:hypothetical protein